MCAGTGMAREAVWKLAGTWVLLLHVPPKLLGEARRQGGANKAPGSCRGAARRRELRGDNWCWGLRAGAVANTASEQRLWHESQHGWLVYKDELPGRGC